MTDRMLPPPLGHRAPDCSICGKETCWDDGFVCEACAAHWPERIDGEAAGEWLDDEETQCPWEAQPWQGSTKYPELRQHTYRCLLNEGHTTPNGMVWHHGVRTDRTPYPDSTDTYGWLDCDNESKHARRVEAGRS